MRGSRVCTPRAASCKHASAGPIIRLPTATLRRPPSSRENRPLYAVRHADEGRIVLQWGAWIPTDEEDSDDDTKDRKKEATESLVVSGGIKGAGEVVGKPAILDIPTGKGRVVAFDFDPIHRYLTVSDFRLVLERDFELERPARTTRALVQRVRAYQP